MRAGNDAGTKPLTRAVAALKTLFVADALAMPVHWYYRPGDIERAFPGGIGGFESAPDYHPSSIMSLHSTSAGGRKNGSGKVGRREIVGEVILKGKRKYWQQPNLHYHRGMRAGENTLNAHCARVVMRSIIAAGRRYDGERFLDDYIAFMTADPPLHPDTYAESYHRGFFANLERGLPRDRCGALTHDTPSIGGLVTIAPLVLAERLQGTGLEEVQALCRRHLFLTHPDETLALVCRSYVELLDGLLFRSEDQPAAELIARSAESSMGLNLPALLRQAKQDTTVIGGIFSPACYISGSWPGVLYLAYKYLDEPQQALIANCNLGGDNVHRGAVLGALLGLATGRTIDGLFERLAQRESIEAEIDELVSARTTLK